MLRLHMLGGLSLDRSTDSQRTPLNGAAVQRRPLALLAFLATAGVRGRSRDEVMLHLWPDSTPARARNVLKQTFYALRRDLGEPELFIVQDDRFRINPDVLTNDVSDLEAALDRGETEGALALYRGPFLDGVSLGDVPEFERWVRSERERLAARIESARAGDVDARPSSIEITADAIPTRPPQRRARTRLIARGGVAALVAVTSLGALQTMRRVRDNASLDAAVDPAVLAVVPFRVAGADSSLAFLGTGMVDLLAAQLSSEPDGVLRAVDPRAALSAWQRVTAGNGAELSPGVAVRTAQQLRAGRVLVGSVMGTSSRLVLAAQILSVPGGAIMGTASVSGIADSLPALVDRLGATLLLGSDPAVGPVARSVLGATPLAGVRDYVEGQTEYRLGHYDDAVRRFSRALSTDSTFAPAALGLARAAGWAGTMLPVIDRAAQLAWAHRDRLAPPARLALLASFGGPDALARGYVPDTTAIAAWERAAEADPDNPEVWYQVGDRYLHLGPQAGVASSLERAQAALHRAVSLDPMYAPAVVHLVQVAARVGDTATAHQVGAQLLRHDSTSEAAEIVRWRMAVALGDSTTLLALRARLARLPTGALHAILATAECDAVDLGDADRAIAEMLRRAATPAEREFALLHAHAYALNRGRWNDALRATEALGDVDPAPRWHLRIRVLDALYAGGDSAAARAAADSLRRFADGPLARDAHARDTQYEDIAVVAQWELWHGDRRTLARALDHLSAGKAPGDTPRRVVANRVAAALLHAVAANMNGARDLAAVEALDTLLVTESAATYDWPRLYPNLAAAHLFVLNGRPDRALVAARRRVPFFPEGMYLTPSLAIEATLRAQLGDTAGAVVVRHRVEALQHT